jgi:hypothetical protein
MNTLNTTLTISRPRGGNSDQNPTVTIQLTDQESRTRFASITIPLSLFSEAMFGLAEVQCKTEVRGLDQVGKVKVTKQMSEVFDVVRYDRKEAEQMLIERYLASAEHRDWKLDSSLTSRDSMVHKEGKMILHYRLFRYVEKKPIHTLACCVCGQPARCRQWWNRDTGYGVCAQHGKDEIERNGNTQAESYYGVQGYHWDIPED